MTRNELLMLVQRIMDGADSEEEHDELIELLEKSVLHPRVLDLIYHPEREPTAGEVVDRALAYRPIVL